MKNRNSVKLSISGVTDSLCQAAIDQALQQLATKTDSPTLRLINNCKIRVKSGLISSGGQTNAEKKVILLDKDKSRLTLQQAEDFLVKEGILNHADWTVALPTDKGKPWSCLAYQLIHEIGHLVDGVARGDKYNRMSPDQAPTKYGRSNASEAFAETFSYWIFNISLRADAKKIVTSTLAKL